MTIGGILFLSFCWECVCYNGVRKDKEVKFNEIDLTLGRGGEGRQRSGEGVDGTLQSSLVSNTVTFSRTLSLSDVSRGWSRGVRCDNQGTFVYV